MAADASHPAPGPFTAAAGRLRRPAIAFLALGLVWAGASGLGLVDPLFLPSPAAVLLRGASEFSEGTMLVDLAASLRRNLSGFAIGAAAGLPLGLVLGFSSAAARIFGPTFLAFRQIALFAWVPLLSVWFGGDDAGKIAFIALAAFQPIVVNTSQGVRGISPAHRELAAALAFTRLDYARLVALPGAMSSIFTGLGSGLIYAWLATLGSELFLNVTPGIGGRLNEASQLFQMDLLFVGIFILAGVGLIFGNVAAVLEASLLKRRTS